MTHSECLAYLRRMSGDEQILECLRAMAASLHGDDPTCVILDAAHDQIEANVKAAEDRMIADANEAELWEADDKACRRANATSIPYFLTGAV